MRWGIAFGKALQVARNRAGFSQHGIAQLMGVSQSTWSRKETGQMEMSCGQLVDFAEHAGVKPADVFDLADTIWRFGAVDE